MNDVRRQHRKDRKATRAQERIDKKAERAKAKSDEAERPKRIIKLARMGDGEVALSRSRIVADASAFGVADLEIVRTMMIAIDALLESARSDDVARVRRAAELIVGGDVEPRELAAPVAAALPAPELPRAHTPVPPPEPSAPSQPVQVPTFLRAPTGETRSPAMPPPTSSSTPLPPAPVIAPPPPAVVRPPIEDEGTAVPETSPTAAVPLPPPPARADGIAALSSTAPALSPPAAGLPFAPTSAQRTDPLARFPLNVYASVCAELQARPHLAKGILDRYGLSDPALREAVDRGHRERIASDPALRVQFDEMLMQARIALQR